MAPDWWKKPRKVTVVVDNPSWILSFAERLVEEANAAGDQAFLARNHDEIGTGDVAFYLGCIKITPPEVLGRNRRNLIVHASDLPTGRGFSPVTWNLISGENTITMCLLEAVDDVDAGPIVQKTAVKFEGHELIKEIRSVVGENTVTLCSGFLAHDVPLEGQSQKGKPTYLPRRYPKDSELDPDIPLSEQFDLLRVVDNANYPAFFRLRGKTYKLEISKMDD